MDSNNCPSGGERSLALAIVDAERLLSYASAKGIALPKDVIEKIIAAKQLCGRDENDTTTFALQQDFWLALTQLSAATRPATVESLRYAAISGTGSGFASLWACILRQPPIVQTVPEVAVRRARNWAMLGLITVALCQVYYELGSSTLNGYNVDGNKFKVAEQMIENDEKTLENMKANPTPDQAAVLALTNKIATATIDNEAIEDKNKRKDRLMTTILFLKGSKADPYEEAQRVISILEGLLLVLKDFLLPMGWGFLGAALYVSRSLADDIKAMAYAPDRAILHRSRYVMGLVAGFTVAKFYTVWIQQPGTNAVTPFAMALVVGYSVEVLFTLLDKLIATFSTR